MYLLPPPLVNRVHCLDALQLVACIPSNSVDMVLTDPPYGVHEMAWDIVPHLSRMFVEMNRIIRPQGVIVVTSQQPFTTDCINANRRYFKYETIWEKTSVGDVFNAKNKPLRLHENILVFSKGVTANGEQNQKNRMSYFPQDLVHVQRKNARGSHGHIKARVNWKASYDVEWTNYPQSIVKFSNASSKSLHPNQKPIKLFEYLIRTYTEIDGLVVDPFVGSGTTAVAARNLNRRYIVGDSSPEYCAVAEKRLAQPYTPNFLEMLPKAEVLQSQSLSLGG
jgi:site-specific DNA-methyltransferase (adenine-specific)